MNAKDMNTKHWVSTFAYKWYVAKYVLKHTRILHIDVTLRNDLEKSTWPLMYGAAASLLIVCSMSSIEKFDRYGLLTC